MPIPLNMATLYLLRHAKAEKPVKHAWDPADDKSRPLTASGMADAAAVGRWFRSRGVIPGVAVVSPALRAMTTWSIAAAQMDAATPVRVEEVLYEARVADLLRIIRALPAEFTSAIIVGHNPSLSDLLGVDLPTCALARVDIAGWESFRAQPSGVKVRRLRADDESA